MQMYIIEILVWPLLRLKSNVHVLVSIRFLTGFWHNVQLSFLYSGFLKDRIHMFSDTCTCMLCGNFKPILIQI